MLGDGDPRVLPCVKRMTEFRVGLWRFNANRVGGLNCWPNREKTQSTADFGVSGM